MDATKSTPWRPPRPPIRRALAAALATVLAIILSGCNVGRGSAIEITEEDTVKIGVIPAIAFAPVYIAIEQGYFEDADIKVETQVMQNAAAIAPAVINGQLQFGTAASSPFIAASAKGLPLLAVAGMSENTDTSNDGAFMVGQGSPVNRPRDLEGRAVAINGVAALPHVAIQEAIRKDGGDPSKVNFVVMGFPEMPGALAEGRVDAVGVTEPFTSAILNQGGRLLTRAYAEAFVDKAPISMLFTAGPFAETNPDVTRKVQHAIGRAVDDAKRDPELVARVMTKHGGIPPEAFESMTLSPYTADVNAEGITQISEVMVEFDYIADPIDGEAVMLP
jgi:NitT/TauT family transport system substrate-binding protein